MHRLDCGWQQFQQRLVKLLAVSLILSTPLFAQQGRGTISGTVTDPSGAAVPGASITITSVGTNAVFSTQSNEEGFFTAPGLAVGEYVVNAERQGFKKAVRKGDHASGGPESAGQHQNGHRRDCRKRRSSG